MKLSKFLSLFLLISILFLTASPALAAYDDEPKIRSRVALLYESSTGKIIYDKNSKQRAFPASTTKIMTALLALENCEMDEIVTVTRDALDSVPADSSIAGLRRGECLTMYQMLECLLIASGNEVAAAIAFHVGGSIPAFIDMMNARSDELGCTGTHYVNPSGLHDEEHYTTAEDLLKVAAEAMRHEEFRDIVSQAQVVIPPTNKYDKERYFNNTNQLISKATSGENAYSLATGIKTGHTTPAGYCLVSSAYDGETEYIAVVMGGYIDEQTYRNYSYVDSINLFLWGYKRFSQRLVVNSGDPLTELPVSLAKKTDHVTLRAAHDLRAYLHEDDDISALFTTKISLRENISAPIEAGDVLGSLTLMRGDTVYAQVDLVAMNEVERSEGLYYFEKLGEFFALRAVRVVIALLVIALAVYIAFTVVYNRRRRNIARRKKERGLDDYDEFFRK
jgi:D-alanyl-D-alanine carboxypeptidase (penicillin-binding protein 5/6)